jgi:hypothetical protein
MSDTIINATELNVTRIKFAAPKANASGGKSMNMIYNSSAIRIALPPLLNWGATDYVDESGKGNGKFEVALQFPNDEDDKTDETRQILQNLINLESKIKDTALSMSKEWFGKVHKNADVIGALWTDMLKYSKDKNTGEANRSKAPVLRVKLPQWEGVWKSEIYDEDCNKLFPDSSNTSVSP